MSTKKGMVAQILEFLQGGEEGKVKRFIKYYLKDNNKQITVRRDELETIIDELAELEERASDAVLNVNIEAIDTLDSTKMYLADYRGTQIIIIKERKALNKRMLKIQEEIETFELLNKQVS